jgi:hypothetical protein
METTAEHVFINLKIQEIVQLQSVSMIWMDKMGKGLDGNECPFENAR